MAPVSTDRRVARSRAAVLGACSDLVCERGVGGVTVEAVAERSGVAKTTIYRHWPSREALLGEAVGAHGRPDEPSAACTGLRADLVETLSCLARSLEHDAWAAALPSLLDAAGRDPELGRASRRLGEERRRPIADALERAVARGELEPGRDFGRAVDLLAGPLFYRRYLGERPVDEPGFVEAVVDGALAALAAGDRSEREQ